MAIRVVHIGTGNVGALALGQLITDKRFELVGVLVSAAHKVGRDAAELAGLSTPTGVLATDDWDALLATDPQCAVYCAMGDVRTGEAVKDCRRLLRAGIDVVGSAPGVLQYPWQVLPAGYIDKIEADAQDGAASLFITGVDPGFANDLLPLALASTCQQVRSIRCLELADYATYDGATVMFDVMGFGKPAGDTPMLFTPGILAAAWGTSIQLLAAGLGVQVDRIEEFWEGEPAPEAFDVAAGHIPAGGLAAVRFEIRGIVAGRAAIVIEHVTRLRDDLRPDWKRPAQEGGSYRIEIEGEPSYAVDICPTSVRGDHNHAAIVAAAGRIVNAVPAVLAAEPGIRTTLDLPFVLPTGVFVAD